MHTKRTLALVLAAILAVVACSGPARRRARRRRRRPPASAPAESAAASAPAESAAPTPLAVDPAEAVITGVEPNAEIGFWTFCLSPTFDQYIKDTIARFEATYPGVKVNWEDHQATFQDDLKNSFARGQRAGRHQPVGR